MVAPLELHLQRLACTDLSTIGALFVDDAQQCFTLEDRLRLDGVKVPRETAIPVGRYQIIVDYSTRFKRHLPHLLNVPNFTGIRIHPGNTDADTEGCILVGMRRGINRVDESRIAFKPLFDLIVDAINLESREVWITIANPKVKVKAEVPA